MNHSLIKKNNLALLLKTNGATFSILDKEECLRKINQIKNKFRQVIGTYQTYIYYMVIINMKR